MGCGKSKHDVVTGNTKTVRKPSESESVNGKEKETIKRQESCRCRKTNDISGSTVENNSKKPDEKDAGVNCNPKAVVETNDDEKNLEEKEKNSSPTVAAIVPENILTEETVNNLNENVVSNDEQKEKVEIDETVVEEKNDGDVDTQIPPPVTELRVQETPTRENNDTEILSSEVEEPKSDVETRVTELEVQETLITENDNTEIPPSEDEEPKSDEQTPVTELGVQETPTTENDEIPATSSDETQVLKDEDKVDDVEENPANITKEVESSA